MVSWLYEQVDESPFASAQSCSHPRPLTEAPDTWNILRPFANAPIAFIEFERGMS